VVRAANRYQAPAVAADITVLRAGEGCVTEFADHPETAAPDWGWSRLTTGRVAVVTVPGTHHSMLRPPHVSAVAAAIRDRTRTAVNGGREQVAWPTIC
jgi:thioesterase domain-containing protein